MTTRVHILGSGTPTPTPERFGSAFAVDVSGRIIMIDCGPAATWKLVKAGFMPGDISDLFFTHHHFDHDVDYPCFLLTRWDQSIGTEDPLRVYGPAPTVRLTDQLIGPDGAFAHDYRARIGFPTSQRVFVNRGGTLPRRPPVVGAVDIEPGHVQESGDWIMRCAVAQHAQPFLDCLAYRLETADGSMVFTGDTEPCDSIVRLARGADVMFCMCWDHDAAMAETGEGGGQCGVGGAAQMASAAKVSRLVLVHTGPHVSAGPQRDLAVRQVQREFDGEVVFADELEVITLVSRW